MSFLVLIFYAQGPLLYIIIIMAVYSFYVFIIIDFISDLMLRLWLLNI